MRRRDATRSFKGRQYLMIGGNFKILLVEFFWFNFLMRPLKYYVANLVFRATFWILGPVKSDA